MKHPDNRYVDQNLSDLLNANGVESIMVKSPAFEYKGARHLAHHRRFENDEAFVRWVQQSLKPMASKIGLYELEYTVEGIFFNQEIKETVDLRYSIVERRYSEWENEPEPEIIICENAIEDLEL